MELRARLASPWPSVRRAVSEGLRPWTASKRAPFANDPQRAIDLLGFLRDDESRSVQESAGNALRDIWRKHPELVLATVQAWIEERPESRARRTIAHHALEQAVKTDPERRQLRDARSDLYEQRSGGAATRRSGMGDPECRRQPFLHCILPIDGPAGSTVDRVAPRVPHECYTVSHSWKE